MNFVSLRTRRVDLNSKLSLSISIFLAMVCMVISCAQKPVVKDEGVADLRRQSVNERIQMNVNSFKECYSAALKVNSDYQGKVNVKWSIDEKGAVLDPQVESSDIDNKVMQECLIAKIKEIKFEPSFDKNVVVEVIYPFVFEPVERPTQKSKVKKAQGSKR